MALTPSFFNKREPVSPVLRQVNPTIGTNGQGLAVATSTQLTPPTVQPAELSALNIAPVVSAAQGEHGAKLTVGHNIKLKGVEITDCDTLIVEGMVEATMDSRLMQISERGVFKGSAQVDIAEIHGHFDGQLTVRQKLVIFASGSVKGVVSYGKLVIEEGGQLSGDVKFGVMNAGKSSSPEKSVLSVAG